MLHSGVHELGVIHAYVTGELYLRRNLSEHCDALLLQF
jgi:hypothetical protein